MEDDSHPVAMGSGMLVGMALGLWMSAGMLVWQDAAAKLCSLMATEAGRNAAVECPRSPLPMP